MGFVSLSVSNPEAQQPSNTALLSHFPQASVSLSVLERRVLCPRVLLAPECQKPPLSSGKLKDARWFAKLPQTPRKHIFCASDFENTKQTNSLSPAACCQVGLDASSLADRRKGEIKRLAPRSRSH